jgi:hypothetical protein
MRLVEINGGNPYIGQLQHALLRQAGFGKRVVTLSLECDTDPIQNRAKAQMAAAWIQDVSFGAKLVELGLANWAELQQIIAAWQTWGEHLDSWMAWPWCEVVGWKV